MLNQLRMARGTVLRLCLLIGVVGALAWGARLVRVRADSGSRASSPFSESAVEKVRRVGSDVIELPASVASKIGATTARIAAAKNGPRLPPFQGCLALDNNALARVRSRFAGEVVALATARTPNMESAGPGEERPLRSGDCVEKGQLLAVVWSKDLGEKKSELADALSKHASDLETLKRLQALYRDGATAERSLRDAERNVQSDKIAVDRAERTLRSWRLTNEELAAVRADADRPSASSPSADGAAWARVEVRAPIAGVLLEKNVAVGDLVDTASDLFKIGDLSHLVVWAHVYEEDLALLQSLPKPIPWKLGLPCRPNSSFNGVLEQVGAVIDPNQHTALASGRVENPGLELKIGQYVTASIEVPVAAGELEAPAGAVVEDGRESIVFCQEPGDRDRFVRRRVRVLRRCRDVVALRSEAGSVQAGDNVLASGALLLQDALASLPLTSQAR